MVPHALPLPAVTQCMVGIESKKILKAQGRPQTSTEHIYLRLPGSKCFSLQKAEAAGPRTLNFGMGYKAGLWSCHAGGPHWKLVLSKPAKRHLGIKKNRKWHECLVGTSLHELVSQVDKPQSQRQCTVKGITSFCSPPFLAHWCGAGWPSSGDQAPFPLSPFSHLAPRRCQVLLQPVSQLPRGLPSFLQILILSAK